LRCPRDIRGTKHARTTTVLGVGLVSNEVEAPMSKMAKTPRSERELEAREILMHEEFKRQNEAWENGIPAEEVLRQLEAIIESKR
jgi:hypothetical protein